MRLSKTCTRCNINKTIDQFGTNKSGKYGVNSRCKTCRSEYHKHRRSLLRDELNAYKREYDRNNRDKSARYQKSRRAKSKLVRLQETFSTQIRIVVTGRKLYRDKARIRSVVGLSSLGLVNYLWSTFEENYGIPRNWVDISEIQIDHIKPKSTATTIKEVKKLNHYTNLQLLFKEDNMKKGKRIKNVK